jgi:hypothetical protein
MIKNDNFDITRDFFIQVKPTFNERNEWSGEVDLTVAYPDKKMLTKKAYAGIDFFVRMLISSVSVMEIDPYVREAIHNYVTENYPDDFTEMLDEMYESKSTTVEVEHDGNIIKLNFVSDREGNA